MPDFSLLTSFAYPHVADPDDPRVAELIKPYSPEAFSDAHVALLGIPTDEGIARNGGRTGASKAPAKIRQYFSKLTTYSGDVSIDRLRLVDLGDIPMGPLEQMHDLAREIITDVIAKGKLVVAMGGGHDVTYPLVKGFAASTPAPINLINIDAHLDVRPLKNGLHHSGSSFRLILEEGLVDGDRFHEFGVQRFVISESHAKWVLSHKSEISFYDLIELDGLPLSFSRLLGKRGTHYVSFDIDSIRAADAPGVSATSPIGFSAGEAFWMCREAGRTRSVRMIDFVEVSPDHDVDDRTAKLAARMIANFLAGVSERG